MRVTLDLRGSPQPGPVGRRRLAVGHFPTVLPPTFTCTGKDRVTQSWPLSAPGDWLVQAPAKLGPYERMTLVRLCVALEKLGGRPAEHDLGPDFEEDLEAIRKQPWPGAISEIGLVL